jgi:hypothetical protein
LARDFSEAVILLEDRYGEEPASIAHVMEGVDLDSPMARSLLSDALADLLMQAREDPDSPLVQGLDVAVEQRFAW